MTELVSIADRYREAIAKADAGEDISDFKIIDSEDNFNAWNEAKSRPVNITEFDKDPRVLQKYENVVDYLSQQQGYMAGLLDPATLAGDTPSEMLRDDNIRILTMLRKAQNLENAPESVQQDYRDLRELFDRADIDGFAEWAKAVKDYGIDVFANYETVPLVLAGIFSGGSAPAAAHAGVRTAVHGALKQGGAALAKHPVGYTAAYTGALTGIEDLAHQNLEMSIDEREDWNAGQTAFATVLGTGLGAGLGYGATKLKSLTAARNLEKDLMGSVDVDVNPNKGLQLIDEGIEGEWIPKSTGDVMNDVSRLLEGSVAKDVTPDEKVVAQFVKDVGGGEATREELTSIITNAVASGATGEEVKSKIAFDLYKLTTDLTGNFWGKAAGKLSPYVKYSKTAESLRKRLAHEFGEGFSIQEELIGFDFGEVAARITGDLNEKYLRAVEPLALNTVKGELADSVNAALNRAIRGQDSPNQAINTAARKIRAIFKEIGGQLKDEGFIDNEIDNYIPRMWNRKAIENQSERFARLLVDQQQAPDIATARGIVEEMLDKQNQLATGTGGHFFSAKRRFTDILDDSVFADFMETDLLNVVNTYNFQAGKSLAKKRVLGVRNESEFIRQWIDPIADEMQQAGRTLSRKDRIQIRDLYRVTTSENLERYGDKLQAGVDAYALANRLAYLPLATIGSLTEIFINISKAGVRNSIKGFKEASETAFKTISKDLHSDLMTRHGLTANEAWRELKLHGMAMEQAQAQIGNRLAGDDLAHEGLQKVSNKFFRLNFLDQWTKFVQLTSFSSGKHMIERNLKELAGRGADQAMDRRAQTLIGELNELGVDWKRGVQWINNGATKEDEFYKEFISGAARYTNAVILQPTAMSNLKPLLHSKPQTSILFQLLGYPAAFTNVVLKGAAKQLIKNPTRNAPKVLAAGLMMTETARWTNWMRSQGRSEEDREDYEIYRDAIARWGGNGVLLDTLQRAQRSAQYSNNKSAYIFAPFGPTGTDAFSISQGKWASTAGGKVPFIGLGNTVFGPERMKEYRKDLRDIDREIAEKLIPDFKTNVSKEVFAKGGVVDVPNAPQEPDERIDKMTGLPYNFQAGAAHIDNEETELKTSRLGFAGGGAIAREVSDFFFDRLVSTIETAGQGVLKKDVIEDVANGVELNVLPVLSEEHIVDDMLVDLGSPEDAEEYILRRVQAIFDENNSTKTPEQEELFRNLQNKEVIGPDDDDFWNYQKLRGYTDEQTDNYIVANELEDELNAYDVNAELNAYFGDLKAQYDRVIREGYRNAELPEEYDTVANFLAEAALTTKRWAHQDVGTAGMQKGMRQHIAKILKEGDPEIREALEEIKGTVPKRRELEEIEDIKADRQQSLDMFLDGSEVTHPVYRGVSSFQDFEYDPAFAFPREIGVHVGNEGQANYILAQTLDLNKALDDLRFPDRNDMDDFFMEEIENRIRKLEDHEASGTSYPFPKTQRPENIPQVTMLKGYISLKKPLKIPNDQASWDSRHLFFENALNMMDYIEEGLGRKLTDAEEDEFLSIARIAEDLSNRQKNFEAVDDIEEMIYEQLMSAKVNLKARRFLEKLGFDGVTYRNDAEPSYAEDSFDSYILFKPEQFKHIHAKSFDPQDPRDMYFFGGLIKKIKDKMGSLSRAKGKMIEAGGQSLSDLLGIKPEDLKWAKSQRDRYPASEAYDGMGDAAAHLALGYITKGSKFPRAALHAINAREFVTVDRIGGPMDIHNNKLGATIKAGDYEEANAMIDKLINDRKAMFMTPAESKRRRGYESGGYVVKRGDTLSKIAQRSGTTIEALKSVNPEILQNSTVSVDQEIALPLRMKNSELRPIGQTKKAATSLRNKYIERNKTTKAAEAVKRLQAKRT